MLRSVSGNGASIPTNGGRENPPWASLRPGRRWPEAGAGPKHVVRMIWYPTDRRDYLREAREIGAIYRAVIDSFSVAMTTVHVAALIEDLAKVEIEVTAVVPN